MSLNILLSHSRSPKVIGNGTIRNLGYGFLFALHSNCGCIFSCFDTIHECDRQTSRQTSHDGIASRGNNHIEPKLFHWNRPSLLTEGRHAADSPGDDNAAVSRRFAQIRQRDHLFRSTGASPIAHRYISSPVLRGLDEDLCRTVESRCRHARATNYNITETKSVYVKQTRHVNAIRTFRLPCEILQ